MCLLRAKPEQLSGTGPGGLPFTLLCGSHERKIGSFKERSLCQASRRSSSLARAPDFELLGKDDAALLVATGIYLAQEPSPRLWQPQHLACVLDIFWERGEKKNSVEQNCLQISFPRGFYQHQGTA